MTTVISSPQRTMISVVITAHNEAERIGECLKSLAKQTGIEATELEIILVDDRSTDGTAEVARACHLPNFVLLSTQGEKSRSLTARQAALDLGLRASKGEIVAIFDADAILAPDSLAKLATDIRLDRADVTAGFVVFKSQTGSIGDWQTVDVAFYLGVCRLLAHFGWDAGVLFGNCAFRRRIYAEAGGFDTIGFALTEDLAFARAARQRGARFSYAMTAGVEVAAAHSWDALIERARRVGTGAFGPLSLAIGLWMALLPMCLLAAMVGGGTLALIALAIRYGAGALFVALQIISTGHLRLLPRVLIYEPMAISIGLLAIFRSARGRTITWGSRIYGA